MNRQTSTYLDIVRFSAAAIVFFGHLSSHRLTDGLFWQTASFALDAVTAFFVLSGFVIAYVTDSRERSATVYAVSRMARIYSVVVPVVIFTMVFDAIGTTLKPGLYSPQWGYVAQDKLDQILSSISFTGEIWTRHVTLGSSQAYWSLNYEVWYYVIFGCFMFGPRRWNRLMAVAAVLIAGPKIISVFPAWLAGVGAYHMCCRARIGAGLGVAMWLGSIPLWLGLRYACGHGWLPGTEIFQDNAIAFVFAIHLVGYRFGSVWWPTLLRPAETAIRWFAGATFTLYLLHLPLAQILAAASPWAVGSAAGRTLVLGGTFIAILLVAEFTERRKAWWRTFFALLLSPWWRARPTARHVAGGDTEARQRILSGRPKT